MDYEKMTERDWIWTITIAVSCVTASAFFSDAITLSTANTILLILYAILGIAYALYWTLTIPTPRRIIKKINKMGFECGMKEGLIAFRFKDILWFITPLKIKARYRRMVFAVRFTQKELDYDHATSNKMICIVGMKNRDVTLTWNGTDTFVCEYYTVFTSTSDIEREFNSAIRVIDNTLSDLFTLFQHVFSQESDAQEHHIGFRAPNNESSAKIRAHSDENTTN